MMYDEFAKVSKNLKVGGACGIEYYDSIETVYYATEFTKDEMAVLYWKHTGAFETILRLNHEVEDAKVELANGVGSPQFIVGRNKLIEAAKRLGAYVEFAKRIVDKDLKQILERK